jgi:DNA repair protein SbcD/Mre11
LDILCPSFVGTGTPWSQYALVRILHTSDWHVGLQTGHISRRDEHEAFFRWLGRTLAAEAVDVLVVAGDIFDGMQPSNESLRLYYRFLRDVESTGVRDVVVVGGNHDSAAQLDAPREVLSALGVHVVGGYSGETDPLRYLAPLHERGSDEPVAVCLALPYIHEYRLGIRTTDSNAEATRRAFIERFRWVYGELADLAEQRFPGLPLVATGHLTMGKLEEGDCLEEIHQVGFIDSLPANLLDPRLRYVALGHVHRAFPVERDRIWYSGSPIPVSLVEMRRPRQVLLVDLHCCSPANPGHDANFSEVENSNAVRVRPINVPVSRELLEHEGTEEEVIVWLKGLSKKVDFAPLLHLRVRCKEPQPQLTARIRTALEQYPVAERPLLVELREILSGSDNGHSAFESISLEELKPRQVFSLLCSEAKAAPSDELLQAFDFVATAMKEELDACVAAVSEKRQRDQPPQSADTLTQPVSEEDAQ